jgi:hypothetical protein
MMPQISSGLEPYSPTLSSERASRPKLPAGTWRMSSRLRVKFETMRNEHVVRRSISRERTNDYSITDEQFGQRLETIREKNRQVSRFGQTLVGPGES